MPTTRASREGPAGPAEVDDGLDLVAGLARDLARVIADARDLDAALARALDRIAGAVGAEGGAIYLVEADSGALVRRAAFGPGEGFARRLAADAPEVGQGRAALSLALEAGDERLGVLVLTGAGVGALDEEGRRRLGAAAGVAALGIVNARLRETLAEQDAVRRDLALAADLQRGLLPESDFARCPVIGLNRPARLVSGDFFDFFWRPDGRIPFALGDVAGKGVNAALLMAKAASLFRCIAKTSDDPAALLALLNREICETASRGMFVTMVAGIYDRAAGRVRFANAGHEPPLLRRPDRSYQTFPAEAPPLGILPELVFRTHEIELAGGEFYIFTDGLTEFSYAGGETLGVDGLVQMIEASADMPLDIRLDDLLEELDGAGWEARDDLTVLAIDDDWVRGDG